MRGHSHVGIKQATCCQMPDKRMSYIPPLSEGRDEHVTECQNAMPHLPGYVHDV